ASHKNAIEHLSGPLMAGALESKISVGADGHINVDWAAREPVVLIALTSSLDASSLSVNVSLDPNGANTPLPTLTFESYSESGASLVLYSPPSDASTHRASPFAIALTVTQAQPNGTKTAIPPASIAGLFNVSIVEGIFGRMAYILLQEKQ